MSADHLWISISCFSLSLAQRCIEISAVLAITARDFPIFQRMSYVLCRVKKDHQLANWRNIGSRFRLLVRFLRVLSIDILFGVSLALRHCWALQTIA